MTNNRSTFARIMVIIILVLLTLQFELGMTVNLTPSLPDIPAFSFSFSGIADALQKIGPVALAHASLGLFLVLASLINLIAVSVSRVKGAVVFSALGLLTIALASLTGAGFVLSGFQDDGLSHGMATNFLLSYIFFFLELYNLKGAPKLSPSKKYPGMKKDNH